MITARPLILLTGFGPFPGVPANATSILVPKLARAAAQRFPDARIDCHILPTEWHAGLWEAQRLYAHLKPALAVHFGVAGRASGFEIEARGQNRCNIAADASGCLPAARVLNHMGPASLPTRLPAQHIVTRLRRRGLPAKLSRDAGGYLCNALMYRTLELARLDGATRSGFVHLPSDLVNERYPERGPASSCRMTWAETIEGGIEILAACLGRPTPPARHLPGL